MNKRYVFFVSDRTGISAENIGLALLEQFSDVQMRKRNCPFINSVEKAEELAARINRVYEDTGERPIVFSTITDAAVQDVLAQSPGLLLNLFSPFLPKLEEELGIKASHEIKKREVGKQYDERMEAVNFSLNHDDGASDKNLAEADVILMGVSRSGKTPTCLFLAMQYGIRAANYPLTPDDLHSPELPPMVRKYRHKLFGLTIKPDRLQAIRQERFPNSEYADINTCRREISDAQAMFRRHQLPFVETTHKSVEELAVSIMSACNLRRRF